jgi:hypothetical protein
MEAATPATSLSFNFLARYICRYKPLQGRYNRMGLEMESRVSPSTFISGHHLLAARLLSAQFASRIVPPCVLKFFSGFAEFPENCVISQNARDN